jgi:hypothetical protein
VLFDVQYWWNADLGNVSVTKQAGDVTGVAFVGFDFIAGLALGFGRGHEDAIDSFFGSSSSVHDAFETFC